MSKKILQARFMSFQIRGIWCAIPLDITEGTAMLPEVIAVPGNRSRIFVGVVYIFGKLMSVIDIAPLLNAGSMQKSGNVLIFRKDSSYYALKVDEVGGIVANASVRKIQRRNHSISQTYIMQKRKKIIIIDTNEVIGKHVCN